MNLLVLGVVIKILSNVPVFGTSFESLRVGVGARPMALAGAYAASEGNVWSVFWNPAGLATLGYKELGLGHQELGEGVRQEAFGYAHPRGRLGVLAFTGSFLNVGDIEGFGPGGEKLGKIRAQNLQGGLAWARPVWIPRPTGPEGVYAGARLKYFRETLDDASASGLALDSGLLGRLPGGHTLGLTVRNLGPAAKFVSEKESLPLEIVAGAKVQAALLGQQFGLFLDGTLPKGGDLFLAAGVEVPLADLVALRFGYTTADDLSAGFRAGIGFNLRALQLDYAFLPQGDLQQAHRVTAAFRFGGHARYLQVEAELERSYAQALAALESGRYLTAHKKLKMILDAAPGHRGAQDALARTELKLREASLALEIKERLERGQRYVERNRLMEAMAELRVVLDLDPENAVARQFMEKVQASYRATVDALVGEAKTHLGAKRLQEAATQIDRARVLAPDDARLGEIQAQIEEEKKKLEELRRKARARELSSKALGSARAGDLKLAASQLKEALSLDPASPEAGSARETLVPKLYQAAEESGKKGKDEEALERYEDIFAIAPDEARAKSLAAPLKGAVAARRKERALALNKEALRMYSDGKLEEASGKWGEALRLDPGLEQARLNLERVQKELERKKKKK